MLWTFLKNVAVSQRRDQRAACNYSFHAGWQFRGQSVMECSL
jgi:hypothetical protein